MTPKLVLLALAVVSFSACADDGPEAASSISPAAAGPEADGGAAPAVGSGTENVRVTIVNSRFETTELRVPAGTTVVFENTDPFAHTVTSAESSPMPFGSDELGQGDTFEVTFDEPGVYPYFCVVHPTMRATVIVE